jgi:hypothetical protein
LLRRRGGRAIGAAATFFTVILTPTPCGDAELFQQTTRCPNQQPQPQPKPIDVNPPPGPPRKPDDNKKKKKVQCTCVIERVDDKGEKYNAYEPAGKGQITLGECRAYCRSEFGGKGLTKVIWDDVWLDP